LLKIGADRHRKCGGPFSRLLLGLAVTFAICGCMVGPDYRRPAVDTPQSWRFEEKETKNVADTAWWEQFQDPVLNELIRIGLTENKDVKIAAARVEQFFGQFVTTRASLFPQVSAGATAGQDRFTERGPIPITPGTDNPADNFQLFAGASWELDFWGKLRRATEAARADMLSTEEARRGVILTLVASIANSYINLRSLDKQLEISERTAASRRDSYELFKLRFQGGIISELELSQIRSQYEEALANIPAVQKSIALQEDALSVLLGRNPGPIPRGKTIDELAPPAVPAGLRRTRDRRRPDPRVRPDRQFHRRADRREHHERSMGGAVS
jgi:multidrug efflux system outer membrane protein